MQVSAVQMYEAVANVVSQAFGSEAPSGAKDNLSSAPVVDKNRVKTSHEAISLFKDIFG